MARRATLSLDALTVTRAAAAPTVPAARPAVRDSRRGQTLRLEPEAWEQLKLLAVAQRKPAHDLLVEAVNLLFDRYERPSIAG